MEHEEAAIFERIETAREYGASDVKNILSLMSKFDLTKKDAEERISKY